MRTIWIEFLAKYWQLIMTKLIHDLLLRNCGCPSFIFWIYLCVCHLSPNRPSILFLTNRSLMNVFNRVSSILESIHNYYHFKKIPCCIFDLTIWIKDNSNFVSNLYKLNIIVAFYIVPYTISVVFYLVFPFNNPSRQDN